MSKYTVLFGILSLFSINSKAQEINVSGKVTDRAGLGISGIQIELVRSGITTITNADGLWSIPNTSMLPSKRAPFFSASHIGNSIELYSSAHSSVLIDIIDIRGAKLGSTIIFDLKPGKNTIQLPNTSRGIHWVKILENTLVGRDPVNLSTQSISNVAPANRSMAIESDTIQIKRQNVLIGKIPLAKLDTSGVLANIDTGTAIPWGLSAEKYGSIYDIRDGRIYRTVNISGQIWMAENLNFKTDSSWWFSGFDLFLQKTYNDSLYNGARYGRLYNWSSANALPAKCGTGWCLQKDSCKFSFCDSIALLPRRGVCPIGWHIPTKEEYDTLDSRVEVLSQKEGYSSGRYLRALNVWKWEENQNKDAVGFRLLPAGYRLPDDGRLVNAGTSSQTWTSTEDRKLYAYVLDVYSGNGTAGTSDGTPKNKGNPLRCLMDYK